MSERQAPQLEMPPVQDFMLINGDTYFLEKAPVRGEDLLKHLKNFYQDNLEELKNRVNQHVSVEGLEDLNQQVARIERHLTAGIIALPDNLRSNGTVLYLMNNRVYQSRVLLYRPKRISCTLQRIEEWLTWTRRDVGSRDRERYSKFSEWATTLITHYKSLTPPRDLAGIKVDISVEQDLYLRAVVASYCEQEGLIYVTPPHGSHFHAYSDGKLCTGNTPANIFWEDPGFEDNFNSLNPHSFANNGDEGRALCRSLLKNQYFVLGQVRENEGGAWRVS